MVFLDRLAGDDGPCAGRADGRQIEFELSIGGFAVPFGGVERRAARPLSRAIGRRTVGAGIAALAPVRGDFANVARVEIGLAEHDEARCGRFGRLDERLGAFGGDGIGPGAGGALAGGGGSAWGLGRAAQVDGEQAGIGRRAFGRHQRAEQQPQDQRLDQQGQRKRDSALAQAGANSGQVGTERRREHRQAP